MQRTSSKQPAAVWNDRYNMSLDDFGASKDEPPAEEAGDPKGELSQPPSRTAPSEAGRPALEIILTASFDLILPRLEGAR